MNSALNVKVNIKPVFSNMVHTDVWEGPCRVGAPEELTSEHDIRVGKEDFKIWKKELVKNLSSYANILEPVYLEYTESFVVPEKEFAKLEKDAYQTDIYLITYRIPGLERFKKPISMINLGPTPIDLVAFYKSIGIDGYMAHDYEEYNELIELLHVQKAIANTKLLILSGSEHIPVSVNSSIHDLTILEDKYGIRNNRFTYRMVFDEMNDLSDDDLKYVAQMVDGLLANSTRNELSNEYLTNDIRFYRAVEKLMEKYECNGFTIPCKDLCASRFPAKNKCVPCLTHSLLKDRGLPTSCEEDINAWLATTVLMFLSKKSVFMGNPVLVKKGKYSFGQLGIMKGLVSSPSIEFDEEVLEIHHSVPGIKMDGFDKEGLPYELGHFTHEGWGGRLQVNMADNKEKVVTIARFNRNADKIIVTKGEILDCEFREQYCSPAVFYRINGGVRAFRQKLAKLSFGHHLSVVYGDYIDKICELGEIMGFEVIIHE